VFCVVLRQEFMRGLLREAIQGRIVSPAERQAMKATNRDYDSEIVEIFRQLSPLNRCLFLALMIWALIQCKARHAWLRLCFPWLDLDKMR
jgi:hypothetical protein